MSHADALAHLRAGRPQAAAALLDSLLREKSADAKAWFLLGACRHALNELPAAASAFSRSLSLDPANLDAQLAYITVLRAAGNAKTALAAAQQAQKRFLGDARFPYAGALCLEDLGRFDDALAHYDLALRASPDLADALHNRGLLLARLGRLKDAETNQRRYVEVHPGSARAHGDLADVLLALGRFQEALRALDAAERLSPADITVRVRGGVALAAQRRFADANEIFTQALATDAQGVARYVQRIAPGVELGTMLSPENQFFWQSHLALQRCDWASWSACAEEMHRLPSTASALVEPAVAFIAFHLPLSGTERHAVARHVAAAIEERVHALPPPIANARSRLKIGILSPDLREHLNGYLLLPFFELLDRDRFELHAYSLTADDRSDVRARLHSAADYFRDTEAMSDAQAAAAIRNDDVDILIDTAGHTTGGRFGVTARRPARLQVLYLGFAGSLGSRRVDYAIADPVAAGSREEWSEQLVLLPNTYYLYDFRAPAPAESPPRRDYGLPEHGIVYCAFHKAEKISPDAFELWMRILTRVPGSVLWLLALPDVAQRNLKREALARGVDPARLRFAPFDTRQRYLARQKLGDLMLDTIHHSAMTTACDAMAGGLPVLTIKGFAMASRAGESLARAAGVAALVAPDKETYVSLAVELASNPERLAGYRRTLQARRGPLFDTAGRVREIEAALLQIWREYEQRLAPA